MGVDIARRSTSCLMLSQVSSLLNQVMRYLEVSMDIPGQSYEGIQEDWSKRMFENSRVELLSLMRMVFKDDDLGRSLDG